MSSHTNNSQAHDFYYRGVDLGEEHYYRGCSLNYSGDEAVSYSTVIAKVIPRRGYKKEDVKTSRASAGLTLLSFYSMSPTTGRHISHVAWASPFERVYVPFKRRSYSCYGTGHIHPEDLPGLFRDALAGYAGGLSRRDERYQFTRLVQALKTLIAEAAKEWADPLKKDKTLKKYLKIDVEKAAEELKAKARKAAARAAKETRALFAKYVRDRKGGEYCEFIRALFEYGYEGEYKFSERQRDLLKKKLCMDAGGWNGPAYVWLSGDQVRTSRGVCVPVQEARIAMKLWASGKDMRAYKVGSYSVVSYQGGTIQIGCHKIPRENMLALYEAVIGEPFPGPKEAQP